MKSLTRLIAKFTQGLLAKFARSAPQPREDFDSILDPCVRIERSGRFNIEDIGLISNTYKISGSTPGTEWDRFRHKHLILPDWFKTDLDPLSDDYFQQQMRLWNVISGVDRDYQPWVDESEIPLENVDAIRRPGYYVWRQNGAVKAASDHVIAGGMLMKHSGVEPGMWALEYGAGFGQTALTLARMGVNVDTVDISSTFCRYVKEQAEFFDVNLTPFTGEFGQNPRGDQKYDLIWFYESFHHCVDFRKIVPKLKNYLTPTGKILMAGEPIGKREYIAVPYPWGLRLESDVVAVIRNHRWFELGYSEDFICNFFTNNGYVGECFDCPVSLFGLTYAFAPRSTGIDLGKHWIPCVEAEGWHAIEPTGRWTRKEASLSLDLTQTFDALEITATNGHSRSQIVSVTYGGSTIKVRFKAHERKTFRLEANQKTPKVFFRCRPRYLRHWWLGLKDSRALGIFLHRIDYV
jgi:2-polyprenyl-3-methyl-5-hydroxy-6-metoxy-1,4-benzoquinol methylase